MTAALSPRAWHCVTQLLMPFDSVGGVNRLSSYINRNFRYGDDGWQLDADYLDSEGIRMQAGIYSLDKSVDAVFSQGPPITLIDAAPMPAPKALIHAIIQRFKDVASEPHDFRPVHAYYRWQGRDHYSSTLDGIYQSVFPCCRCYATFDVPHRCYNDEWRVIRAHLLRFHLATVSGVHLTLDLNIVPHHGEMEGCRNDLALFIFEHHAPLCSASIRAALPFVGRPALRNPDVRLEVFRFLSRFDLDIAQRCSRRWRDFVDTSAGVLALYHVELTLRMHGGAHVYLWNLSVFGIRPHCRLFDLCKETTPTIIHDLIRNSSSKVKFYASATHSWQCLQWVLGGTTNFSMYQLCVDSYNVEPGLNLQSLQKAVELGGVSKLHLILRRYPHPIEYKWIVTCGSVTPIEKLTLSIYAPVVSIESWIMDLISTSKLTEISFYWHFFNSTLDLSKLPSAVAQVFIDALSLDDLPDSFILDVLWSASLLETPVEEPRFSGALKLSHAVGDASTEFDATAFHLRNARSRDYVTVLVGRKKQTHGVYQTLRVFKGQHCLTGDSI